MSRRALGQGRNLDDGAELFPEFVFETVQIGAAGVGVDGGDDADVGEGSDLDLAFGFETVGQLALGVVVESFDSSQDQRAPVGKMERTESFGREIGVGCRSRCRRAGGWRRGPKARDSRRR